MKASSSGWTPGFGGFSTCFSPCCRSASWATSTHSSIVGAASISAFPFLSGFVTKALILDETASGGHTVAFLMLLFASAGVFHHSGIKIPYFAFFAHDSQIRVSEAPRNMLVAMGLASVVCIAIGMFPKTLYSVLPFEAPYVPYTAHHVVSTLGILGFTGLGFFLLLRQLDPTPTISLDTDWFYRKGAQAFMRMVARPVAWIDDNVVGEVYEKMVRGPILSAAQLFRATDTRVVDGAVHAIGSGTLGLSSILRVLALAAW